MAKRPRWANANAILEAGGDGVIVLDPDGVVVFANAEAARLLGCEVDAMLGADHHALFHTRCQDGQPLSAEGCQLRTRGDSPGEQVHADYFERADGSGFAVTCRIAPILGSAKTRGTAVFFRDASAHSGLDAETLESLEIFHAFLDSLQHTPVILLDRDTTVLAILAADHDSGHHGLRRDNVDGTRLADLLPEDQAEETRTIVADVFDTGRTQRYEQRASLPAGDHVYDVQYSPVRGPDGTPRAVLSLSFDITDRVRAEQQIRLLAFYDSLTGLPNRRYFLERLDSALVSAQRHDRQAALLFLDLDHFKRVNDTLGHSVGDLLLSQVAKRLEGCVRSSDAIGRASGDEDEETSISRLGGDEFTLLLCDLTTPAEAAGVAERVIEVLSAPFDVDGHEVFASPSIGIAFYPDDGNDADTLLKNADTAMYSAKSHGRNRYRFYADSMNVSASRSLYLDGRLRGALERGEFHLRYQPVRNAMSGELVGAEALLRWEDPDTGAVSPAEFIPIAEDTGVILSIGEWVLRTACAQWSQWQEEGFELIRLAVNLSGVQLRQDDLVDRIVEILEDSNLSPANLELEITESTIMQEDASTISALARLSEMGVGIALDDFGTGYSSLSYLRRFPIHRVKIDRSFVGGITTHPDEAALTSAIIAMAHSLRLSVVGEGVETEDQMAFLRDHGCDELQGYLFSPAIPAHDFEHFLRRAKDD